MTVEARRRLPMVRGGFDRRRTPLPLACLPTSRVPTSRDPTSRILATWKAQGAFIRFLNGNKADCAASNLAYVSLREAMQHVDDWAVDWDMDLTAEEVELVRTPGWRAGLVFG